MKYLTSIANTTVTTRQSFTLNYPCSKRLFLAINVLAHMKLVTKSIKFQSAPKINFAGFNK